MTKKLLLNIPIDANHMKEAMEFVHKYANSMNIPVELFTKFDLVLEELFVNVNNYAYPDGNGDIELSCSFKHTKENGKKIFCLYLRDWGIYFNPLNNKTPDIDKSIQDRQIGGLGIFLITEMTDNCFYTRENGINEFKACFFV